MQHSCFGERKTLMTVSDLTANDTSVPQSTYPNDRQRAGYLSLGLLSVVAALIGQRLPLMPSAIFAFYALLCFLQLSPKILAWVRATSITRRIMNAWKALNALPSAFRCSLLAIVVLICLTGLAFDPRMAGLELSINGLLCAGLLLFMGPRDGNIRDDTE